jgi:hypothetical protein
MMSYLKYKLSAFYSALASSPGDMQEAVPLPVLKVGVSPGTFLTLDKPSVLGGGRLCRWIGLLKVRHIVDSDCFDSQLFESFIESILLGKKGMPRPGKQALAKATWDTFYDLTRAREPEAPGTRILLCAIDAVQPRQMKAIPDYLNWESLSIVLRRTVNELFVGQRLTDEDLLKPFIPSSNAHYNYSKVGFGAVGRFFAEERKELVSDLLSGGIYQIKQSKEVGVESDITRKLRGIVTPPKYSYQRLQSNYCKFYGRLARDAVYETPYAKPLSLPEAAKTRTITTGPSSLYFVLKPLQKKMWRILASHPCFTLTGQVISPDYIQERMSKTLPLNKKFASIDYKNATNLIDGRASEIVCDEICKVMQLAPDIAFLFKRSLTGHIMIDPSGKPNMVPPKSEPQRNGQLMGSITSFPILCIINAAICRWTLELDQGRKIDRTISLRDAKLCVNGDDALMPLTDFGYSVWARIGSYVGLHKSIGKVYFSRRFLNMNSTSFRYRSEPWSVKVVEDLKAGGSHFEKACYYRQTPYINMGLVMGMTRSGMSNPNKEGTIGSRCRDMIRLCPKFLIPERGKNCVYVLAERVLATYIFQNIGKLREACIPWFIPEQFGGLGLPCVGRFQPSKVELRLARKIYEHYELPERPEVDWPLWKVASKVVSSVRPLMLTSSYELTTSSGIDTRMVSRNELTTFACLSVLMETNFVEERLEIVELQKRIALDENFEEKSRRDYEKNIALYLRPYPIIKDKQIRFLEGLTIEEYKAREEDRIASALPEINAELDKFRARLRVLQGKGHPLSAQVYEQRVRRVWERALKDGIPLPEPYGRKPDLLWNTLTEYDFPVKYDIKTLPLFELETVVLDVDALIAKDVRLEALGPSEYEGNDSTSLQPPPHTVIASAGVSQ